MRGAWLSLAVVAGCWSFEALNEGAARDGSDAGDVNAPPPNEGGSGEETGVGSDGGASDGATADVFEASGPPAPASCATSGFACAAVAPTGWQGPFALYEGNAANAPSCGAVTQELAANANLASPPPAQCASCTCQNATGASCGTIQIEPQDNTCGGTGFKEQIAINTCVYRGYGTLVSGGYAAGGVRFSLPPVTGGSCAPTVAKPTPTKPAVSWAITAVGCTTLVPTTPGCPAGQVCSAIPAPPFFSKLCVAQDGDVSACPGAPYSQRHLYYKGLSDTRDCAACNCGGPNPAQCAATVSTGTDTTCNAPENVTAAPACLVRDPGGFYYMKATTTLPTVTCPASGGAAIGTATPAQPVTVCCEP
jgi:hypothetical protein